MIKAAKFIKVLTYTLVILLSYSSQCGSQTLKLSVETLKVESWLNLMPGGPGSFHMFAELKLKNPEDSAIHGLIAAEVSIFQLDKKIYSFAPIILTNDQIISSIDLEKEDQKLITVSSKSVLSIDKNLDKDGTVDIFIKFKDAKGNSFIHKIENTAIQKVY